MKPEPEDMPIGVLHDALPYFVDHRTLEQQMID